MPLANFAPFPAFGGNSNPRRTRAEAPALQLAIRVATPIPGAIRVQLRSYCVDSINAVDEFTRRSGTK